VTARAAVTGASGFFGRALEARWAPRAQLRGLFRRRTALSDAWQARGHEVVIGDLDDEAALAALVAGADVVYHCAARMRKDDPVASRRVNVLGTERLARAAGAAGVPRLVYVSSISVYSATRPPPPGHTVTEAVEPQNLDRLNPYSATKYAGELVVRGLASRGEGPAVTIVRPTNVYGPWARSWFLDWARRLERLPVVIGGNVPIDVVHVDDVAAALILAGESAAAANETLHLGHETITLRDFVALVGQVVDRKVWRLPAGADYLARLLVERLYRLAKGTCMSMSLTRPIRYPHTRAQQLIGYEPRIRLEEGFAGLAEWYRHTYLAGAQP